MPSVLDSLESSLYKPRASLRPLGGRSAQVAQLVEHCTENAGVGGSIPPLGTTTEIRYGRPSLFGENLRYVEVVRRITDRHGDDPLARLGFAREVGDANLDVSDRTHRPERRINTLEALSIHVSMTVDQTGDDGLALQINDAGGWCGMRRHCRILADG